MRGTPDILRSLKRYVALALGDEWEVRLAGDEGTFKRPFARAVPTSPAQYPAATATAFLTEAIQAFAVHAYPSASASGDESYLAALATGEALFRAFAVGVGEGRPRRVPIYDYTDLPLGEGSTARHYADFAEVRDLSITEPHRDPDDETLWLVIVDLRLGWRRTVEPSSTGRTAVTIGVRPA